MNRQAVIITTLGPALGLGLLLLSKRQQVTRFAAETVEGLREAEQASLAEKVEETRMLFEDTREAVEQAIEQARARTAGRLESLWDNATRALVATVVTTTGIGLLGALITVIYAPERYQQERLWQTTRSVLVPAMGAMMMLMGWLGENWRKSAT